MAFSFIGILSVLLEAFRPLVPFLIAWIAIDGVLVVYALRQNQFAHQRARRMALVVGMLAMIAAFVFGPTLTQASFANFIALIDWVLLAAMAFGVGVLIFVLTLPVTSLLKY